MVTLGMMASLINSVPKKVFGLLRSFDFVHVTSFYFIGPFCSLTPCTGRKLMSEVAVGQKRCMVGPWIPGR
ncbi:hypothetical protein AQUCO_00300349v1 [Aquilegia coerulea]|uniref:Uncharacterized protein n=1 Tax=Aquilegia coerulea TaxID=218851 RepID=A0A2G5EYD2_AQUCA|nr:hypothetical protein AQUCO_00300349v1 [Aquilegia coerulea]